ncbi:hypothetical protein [Leifsonia sp. NPDC080035]|uniref:Uncharacterized protein n=1 Tax=Leifsonia sp. NPDC080035 TaxID=3143936 RepID=A0AAU7GAN7_9MICO
MKASFDNREARGTAEYQEAMEDLFRDVQPNAGVEQQLQRLRSLTTPFSIAELAEYGEEFSPEALLAFYKEAWS